MLNVSSFSRNKPIIWETFGVSFAKVIDMTRLYILIIFYIKDFQIFLKFLDKPKLSGLQFKRTCKVFLPLPGVPPAIKKKCVWQKMLICFFLYQCFYLNWLRDFFSPLGGIFFIPYLKRSYLIVIFNWQNNGTCLFPHFKNNTQLRQSCDKIHCIPTWFWLLP